jgi:hypothetical protein
MVIDYNGRIGIVGRVGISNSDPLSMLGYCTVTNSAPVIVFGKTVNGTGFRNAFMGYTDSFYLELVYPNDSYCDW